jgi:hypothetical protein
MASEKEFGGMEEKEKKKLDGGSSLLPSRQACMLTFVAQIKSADMVRSYMGRSYSAIYTHIEPAERRHAARGC